MSSIDAGSGVGERGSPGAAGPPGPPGSNGPAGGGGTNGSGNGDSWSWKGSVGTAGLSPDVGEPGAGGRGLDGGALVPGAGGLGVRAGGAARWAGAADALLLAIVSTGLGARRYVKFISRQRPPSEDEGAVPLDEELLFDRQDVPHGCHEPRDAVIFESPEEPAAVPPCATICSGDEPPSPAAAPPPPVDLYDPEVPTPAGPLDGEESPESIEGVSQLRHAFPGTHCFQ
jgi:hypothetical protein